MIIFINNHYAEMFQKKGLNHIETGLLYHDNYLRSTN